MKTTTGMKGGGYYDLNSIPQSKVIESAMPFLLDALSNIPFVPERPLVIADYGCSEGRNSLNLARIILSEIRKSQPDLPVVFVHNDLPSNDFNSFFRNLYSGQEFSYMANDGGNGETNVFALACGASFYEQVLPSGSLSLGLSFSALHWLSQVPLSVIPDHIFSWGRPEAHEVVSRQAESDWIAFLSARAAELMPGGRLFCAMIGADELQERKQPAGKNYTGSIFELMNDVLIQLVNEDKIDRRRYETFLFPSYPRTISEIKGALNNPNSPVHGLFEVNEASIATIPLPMKIRHAQDGDLDTYASSYIAFIRAFSESVFAGNLFDSHVAVDDFYLLLEQKFKGNPDKYESDMHFAFVYLTRL